MSKPASPRTLGSDLKRVDAHVIKPEEYEELPEMTDEMFSRVVFKKAGRPRSANPKQMISLRLPPEVVARWKATGPGWQTRMAKRVLRVKPNPSNPPAKPERQTQATRPGPQVRGPFSPVRAWRPTAN